MCAYMVFSPWQVLDNCRYDKVGVYEDSLNVYDDCGFRGVVWPISGSWNVHNNLPVLLRGEGSFVLIGGVGYDVDCWMCSERTISTYDERMFNDITDSLFLVPGFGWQEISGYIFGSEYGCDICILRHETPYLDDDYNDFDLMWSY